MAAPETRPAWPLTIEVGGLPPSPNRRMAWQKRRRLVRPLADAVAWQARALALPRPLERACVQFTLIHTSRNPIVAGDRPRRTVGPLPTARKGSDGRRSLSYLAAPPWKLPQEWLQQHLYHPALSGNGHQPVRWQWYDIISAVIYGLHFPEPVVVGFVISLRDRALFCRFAAAFLTLTWLAFVI